MIMFVSWKKARMGTYERRWIKNEKVRTGVRTGARVRKEGLEELEKCGQDENSFWVSW